MSLGTAVAMGASLLAAPSWDEKPFISYRDYPAKAVRNEWSAAVLMELLIAPDGRVAKCTPIAGFGNQDFASMFCAIASKKRALMSKDPSGRPSYGVVRELVKFFLQGTEQGQLIEDLPPLKPDFEFEVQQLPQSIGSSLDTTIAVAVDEIGKITSCKPAGAAGNSYGQTACGQMLGTNLAAVRDSSEKPVSYVQHLRVRFVAPGNS
jgi:hypothetical protein